MTRFLSTAFVLALCVAPLGAADAESLPPNAKVLRLAVQPAKLDIVGPFAYSQLVVTATLDPGDTVDVTRLAKFTAPSCVKVSPSGQVRPIAGGSGILSIAVGPTSLEVPVAVTSFHTPAPVGFVKDVQPAMSKMGCNAGTCHGAAQGKVGFKLSLRGYDPIYDFRALTDDLEGRRFNRAAPDRSLMLM